VFVPNQSWHIDYHCSIANRALRGGGETTSNQPVSCAESYASCRGSGAGNPGEIKRRPGVSGNKVLFPNLRRHPTPSSRDKV